MQVRFCRFGALCGVFFVIALTFGNQMATSGEGPMNTKASVLSGFARHRTIANHVGLALAFFGFAAFIVFLGYARERLRQAEDWLAATAMVAGTVMVAVKLGSVIPEYVGQLHAHEISGTVALTLEGLGDGGFVISGLAFAIFVTAAALAGLSGGRALMPRVIAWAGIVVGLPGLVTPLFGLINPGSYNRAPWLLDFVWTLALAVFWAVRAPRPVPAKDTPVANSDSALAVAGTRAGA